MRRNMKCCIVVNEQKNKHWSNFEFRPKVLVWFSTYFSNWHLHHLILISRENQKQWCKHQKRPEKSNAMMQTSIFKKTYRKNFNRICHSHSPLPSPHNILNCFNIVCRIQFLCHCPHESGVHLFSDLITSTSVNTKIKFSRPLWTCISSYACRRLCIMTWLT